MKNIPNFDHLRNIGKNTSLLSEEEIVSIVSRSVISNPATTPIKSGLGFSKAVLAFTGVVVVSGASLLYLHFSSNDTVTTQTTKNTQEQISQQNQQEHQQEPHSDTGNRIEQKKTYHQYNSKQNAVVSDSDREHVTQIDIKDTYPDIEGMKFITLTKDELEKLGVSIGENTIRVQTQEKNVSSDVNEYPFTLSELQLGNETWKSTLLSNGTNSSVVLHPVVITYRTTDKKNESSAFIVNKSSLLNDDLIPTETVAQLSENHRSVGGTLPILNQLVPIRITLAEGRNTAFATLWYLPEQKLMSVLPERYVMPIKNELQVQTDVACKHIKREEACSGFRGKTTIFDICSSDAGAITQSAVYPNPAHGTAQCRYVLVQPRIVSIALYTADGNYIKEILHLSEQSAGEQIVRLPLDDITGGLYLLSISTTEGEKIIQRLLIQ